jgi:hypothetical protein
MIRFLSCIQDSIGAWKGRALISAKGTGKTTCLSKTGMLTLAWRRGFFYTPNGLFQNKSNVAGDPLGELIYLKGFSNEEINFTQ